MPHSHNAAGCREPGVVPPPHVWKGAPIGDAATAKHDTRRWEINLYVRVCHDVMTSTRASRMRSHWHTIRAAEDFPAQCLDFDSGGGQGKPRTTREGRDLYSNSHFTSNLLLRAVYSGPPSISCVSTCHVDKRRTNLAEKKARFVTIVP